MSTRSSSRLTQRMDEKGTFKRHASDEVSCEGRSERITFRFPCPPLRTPSLKNGAT